MSKNVVIVESPSKSHTIEKYLGKDYVVTSSKGHIRELTTSYSEGLGIDPENHYKPKYKIAKGKNDTVKELKKLVKDADYVYLATDPDREGEAISWHLADELGIDLNQNNRIVFNEVTKKAVLQALDHPRQIDMDLVHSQETRRVLDRIIGFKLSKVLQKKIKSKSAGRVQSVALRLIVEKENEIKSFVPDEYWEIKADFIKNDVEFTAKLEKFKDEKVVMNNEEEANAIFDNLDEKKFVVESIESKKNSRSSKPPFTTSTLQQTASTILKFGSKRTMRIAQGLYEGIDIENETVGLITYMRTDSIRLSEDFVSDTKAYIEKKYGKQYVGSVKTAKKTENVQDAHEGIRPTSIERTPSSVKSFLSDEQYKLYSLIYARALASLMSNSEFDATTVLLNNNDYIFKANGSLISFDGYLKVYKKYEKVNDEQLPVLEKQEKLASEQIEKSQHFTKAPSRYSEATLIKALEEYGIGRPSTYATIIDTITQRGYVKLVKRMFEPTESGINTNDFLVKWFNDLINVNYTAQMESELDVIAEGKETYEACIESFIDNISPMIENTKENAPDFEYEVVGTCPECGGDLVKRKGRYGEFIACNNYPECKYIQKEDKSKDNEPELLDEVCPKCGKPMVKRMGRYGEFIACSGYPDCKYIKKENSEYPKPTDETCPNCGKPVVIKRGRFGEFKACSDYPNCKTIIK